MPNKLFDRRDKRLTKLYKPFHRKDFKLLYRVQSPLNRNQHFIGIDLKQDFKSWTWMLSHHSSDPLNTNGLLLKFWRRKKWYLKAMHQLLKKRIKMMSFMVVWFPNRNTREKWREFLWKNWFDFFRKISIFCLLFYQHLKPNMTDSSFNIIVKYLSKYQGKIITNEIIKSKLEKLLDSSYSESKMYKMIYYLKLRGHLVNLKKNLFLVKKPEEQLEEETLANKLYRTILHKHCKDFIDGKRYIWGLKALEIALLSYSIPEEILLVNSKKQSTETILFDRQALLKTYQNKNKNLFSFFFKRSHRVSIERHSFNVAKPELAILETLYNNSPLQKSYGEELIKKRLRKNKKHFDFNILEQLLKESKHNSSINRLAQLAGAVDQELAEKIKSIIKRYGYMMY